MNATAGKILIDGNAAAAIGACSAGVTVVTWYPITPSSSLAESLHRLCRRYRRDPETGKTTFAIVQAEDELAAIGMVLGAGWAGARAMTTTAGPGISLMSEFIGLGYYAEIPAVILDIQRMGPSTGPAHAHHAGRHAQGRLHLSHGDTRHILPLSRRASRSATRWRMEAFDLAERLQTPVFVLIRPRPRHEHLDEPTRSPTRRSRFDRGKVLRRRRARGARQEALGSRATRTSTATAIPYRTLPGTDHRARGAYFTRGSGHDEDAPLHRERPDAYARNMDRLARKFETREAWFPAPPSSNGPGAASGSSPSAPRTTRSTRRATSLRRGGHRDRLPARCARSRSPTETPEFIDAPRARLRRRAEPRRGRWRSSCASSSPKRRREAASHPPLRRAADRRRT